MNQINAAEHLQLLAIAATAAATVTAVSTGVDVTSFVGKGAIVLSSAAGTGTTPTLDVKLQESDTLGGTYTDVAGGAFTQVTGAPGLQKLAIDLDAAKAFLRISETLTGTTPSFARGVSLLGFKQNR